MGKPTICRYTVSIIPLLLKSKISSFWPASVTVQARLCQTCSDSQIVVSLVQRFNLFSLYFCKRMFQVSSSIGRKSKREHTLVIQRQPMLPRSTKADEIYIWLYDANTMCLYLFGKQLGTDQSENNLALISLGTTWH